MKKDKKKIKLWKKILVATAIIILVLVLAVVTLFVVKRPGKETDDMLFDVGMFNPISLSVFTGDAYASSVVGSDDTYNVPSLLNISFKPTVRTKWHTHDGGQILICTYGTGYYQVEGEKAQILRAGDVVLIEPDVKHWHGAGPNGWFSHIAISTNPSNAMSDFLEDVTEEQYQSMQKDAIEFNERTDPGYSSDALADLMDGAMFPIGEAYDFDGNVSGMAYQNELIPYESVFNFPETTNVTFEPAAHTDWHENSGGQILIALGGEGISQVDGEEQKVLHGTDVVYIEPGAKNFYGASENSWFACILIDANTGESEITWDGEVN